MQDRNEFSAKTKPPSHRWCTMTRAFPGITSARLEDIHSLGLGIALAIPLTDGVGICVSALSPHDSAPGEQATAGKAVIPNMGLTSLVHAQEAVAKLSLCQVPRSSDWHIGLTPPGDPRGGSSHSAPTTPNYLAVPTTHPPATSPPPSTPHPSDSATSPSPHDPQ